jgi:hypothetical protein
MIFAKIHSCAKYNGGEEATVITAIPKESCKSLVER